MGDIPEDAAHWDSGDWIEWHRTPEGIDDRPCAAATSEDDLAKLTSLHVSLLRAAKGYYQMTGQHLPVYDAIARVHAAIYCDLPFEASEQSLEETGVRVMSIAPHGPTNVVEVNMAHDFSTLIVVRIRNNFKAEARMIPRDALPASDEGHVTITWHSLPHQI